MPKTDILFDASPMVDSQKTGVGYYVDHLMKSIAQHYGQNVSITGYYFDFLGLNRKKPPYAENINFQKIWVVPGKLLSLCRRLGFQPFLEFFIPKKSRVTLFTNYVALPQINKGLNSVFIYDLSFLDYPEFIKEENLKFLKKFCPPSILEADSIVTISEFTKGRIKHYFPNIKAPIIVAPIPPQEIKNKRLPLSKNLRYMGISPNKYILFMGTIEPRKNIDTLVKGYAWLDKNIRDNYALVIAGGNGWKNEQTLENISKLKEEGLNIILTGYVTDKEKNFLYSNASVFVLPSHYEGFGMPIYEAMQFDIPVILSDIPVFHEVASDSALYFAKDNPRDLSRKIEKILNDSGLRSELIEKSKESLNKYSWEENARILYELILKK